ncbi:MAG: hypothetical protein II128_00390, partial [Atopobiaceae bacterium]|nr:hypothetical protein [Atopobiaceae bacterium]
GILSKGFEMDDKILQMFFDPKRWEYAIEKGCVKGVSKADLYQLCKPEEREPDKGLHLGVAYRRPRGLERIWSRNR